MPMTDTRLMGAIALTVALLMAPAGAAIFDGSKYHHPKGRWEPRGPPNWTPGGKAAFHPEIPGGVWAKQGGQGEGGPGNLPLARVLPAGHADDDEHLRSDGDRGHCRRPLYPDQPRQRCLPPYLHRR